MEYVSSTVSRLVQILVMMEDLLLWMLWWEAKDATGLGALGKRCGSVSQLNTQILVSGMYVFSKFLKIG